MLIRCSLLVIVLLSSACGEEPDFKTLMREMEHKQAADLEARLWRECERCRLSEISDWWCLDAAELRDVIAAWEAVANTPGMTEAQKAEAMEFIKFPRNLADSHADRKAAMDQKYKYLPVLRVECVNAIR